MLNQDIGQLVRDAKPIHEILETLEGQLPDPIEEALILAAYIESHRVQVLKAQKRLSDLLQQDQAAKKRDDLKNLVDSTSGNKIDSLDQSQVNREQKKTELIAKSDRLQEELNQVIHEIVAVDKDLSQIPSTIEALKKERQEQALQAYLLHKNIQSIPGSADEDKRVI